MSYFENILPPDLDSLSAQAKQELAVLLLERSQNEQTDSNLPEATTEQLKQVIQRIDYGEEPMIDAGELIASLRQRLA